MKRNLTELVRYFVKNIWSELAPSELCGVGKKYDYIKNYDRVQINPFPTLPRLPDDEWPS